MQSDPKRKGAHAVAARMTTMAFAAFATIPLDILFGLELKESLPIRLLVFIPKVGLAGPAGALRERIIEKFVISPHGTVKNRLEKSRLDAILYAIYVTALNAIAFTIYGHGYINGSAELGLIFLTSIGFGPIIGMFMDTLVLIFERFVTRIRVLLSR